MDPISNTDRLTALLRQRLRERMRSGPATKSEGSATSRAAQAKTGLAALSDLDGVDQRQLRRGCVQALLIDQFGQDQINDPRFQQVVTRVTDAIDTDPKALSLLDRVVGDLRQA